MTFKSLRAGLLLAAFVALPGSAWAAPFTPGNLVVSRVGDGTAALAAIGTAVFLDEYTPAGVFVQTIALPTTVSGANKRLVAAGNATSELLLTRSNDGAYLLLAGYDAALGTTPITSSTSAAVNRVIARIDSTGAIDTTTALTDAISGGNPRGAASTSGTDLWISGTSSGGGIRYALFGATTSTSLAAAPTNFRTAGIFAGQLYCSSNTGAFRLSTIGTGTPTTAGQTVTNLPGFPTAAGSPYGFFFADLDGGVAGNDTLYVVDDGIGSTPGIQKFSLVSGNWTANGAIAATGGLRGLTGSVSGSTVTLYAAGSSATQALVSLVDTTGYNATIGGTLTVLVPSAGTNKAFRGVAFAPGGGDTTPPTVTSSVRANPSPTGAANVDFTVTFSEAVTGVDTTDFTLTTTGVSGASVTNVAGTGTTRTVTVGTGTGNGTIRLDVLADGTILDLAANALAVPFSSGETYVIDKSSPTVLSIVRANANPSNAASVAYTVTFSEAVTGVDASDFALAVSGVSGASIGSVTGPGATWTVGVNTGTGDGTIGLNLVDDDTILNAALNPLGGVGAGNGNLTGQVYGIDKSAPSVTSIVRASPNPTNGASFNYTVTFSESVTGVDSSDFALTVSGVTGATVSNVTGSGATRTVTITGATGSGTVRLDLSDDDSVLDLAGNPLGGPGAGNGNFTTGEVYTVAVLAKVYFIDIGQGASTLIVSPTGKSLLVDGGPTGQGTAKIVPLLNTLGISTIDYTVVTHYHIDHDDGMTEVINANRVAGTAYDVGDAAAVIPPNAGSTLTAYTNYKNALASHSGTITRTTITPGTVIDMGGGMKATCMAAAGGLLSGGSVYMDNGDLNSESISMLIEFNNFDFLVSGDLTGGGSTTAANTPDVETWVGQLTGDVDVVQFDHHGSTTANNRRFLAALKAEVSVAEIGFTNNFGHPNRETVNKALNIPDTLGNTFPGTALPPPGSDPISYQTDPSPAGDARCSQQGYAGAIPANAGLGTLLLTTDGTTTYSMQSFDDGGALVSPALHLYAVDGVGAGITTNFPPTVVPSLAPAVPLAPEAGVVSAQVFDKEDPVTSVTLNYSLNGAAQSPVSMTMGASNIWSATVPAQPNGTRVDVSVTAVAGGQSTVAAIGYFSGTTPISTLRQLNAKGEPLYLDYTARVSGVALTTTGNFAPSSNDDYVLDGTGAANVFRTTISPSTPPTQAMAAGNTYTVAGVIGQLTGKFRLEVTPPFDGIDHTYLPNTPNSGSPYQITQTATGGAPTPTTKTIAQLNVGTESFEGQLVQIANCTVTSGTIPAAGATVDAFLTINDGTGSFQMKIDPDTDIPGLTTPSGTFTAIGIIQQDDPLRPFDSTFDIAPRNRVDLGAPASGPTLITIAAARIDGNSDTVPDLLNQQVKVRGVVTSVNFRPTGTEYYIQDPTAGVDIFSSATIFGPYALGDNVEVVGIVNQFNGLTEINLGSLLTNVTVLPLGTLPPVSPQVITLSQMASGVGESLEGLLVQVDNVTGITGTPNPFAANTNYTITDATGSAVMRIPSGTNIPGTPFPTPPFSVVGLIGQFDNAAPFNAGYQLLPRMQIGGSLPVNLQSFSVE